jgi:trans-feruloyl-CoA hydratase/vanillin synthase
LRARVEEIAGVLLKKDPNALRSTKWAMRRMTEMTFDNAMDYLIRAQEALNGMGGLEARKEATRQFLDEKTFKPGLGAFDASKVAK